MTMEWKRAHPENVKAASKRYYEKHREKLLAKEKAARIAYRKLHPVQKQVAWNKGIIRSPNSYGAIHLWLLNNHKKRSHCEFCPSKRFLEFALKKGHKHEHNIKNYLTLCSSCHKKYDYTDERRKKLSIAHTGRKITWKDKISAANKGRKLTEAHKRKVYEYQIKHPRPRNSKGQFFKTVIA